MSVGAREDPTPAMLASLDYDVATHPPESLDWMNVLLAQTLTSYRELVIASSVGAGGAKGFMEDVLNRKTAGDTAGSLVGLDRITVHEVELGAKFPLISNARVRPSGHGQGVVRNSLSWNAQPTDSSLLQSQRIELDVDYTDLVSLSISTSLLVNFPRPRFAVLPIALGLVLERFSGTLTLELPSHNMSDPAPILHLSLHPDFNLHVSATSLLGSRAKLQDIPKIEQIILARIRGYVQDRVVRPGRIEVGLPGLGGKPPVGKETAADWEWVEGSGAVDISAEGTTTETSDVKGAGDDEDGLLNKPDVDEGPDVQMSAKIRSRPLADLRDATGNLDRSVFDPAPTALVTAGAAKVSAAWTPRGMVDGQLRYRTGNGVGVGVPMMTSRSSSRNGSVF